jgi:hypothetical protein
MTSNLDSLRRNLPSVSIDTGLSQKAVQLFERMPTQLKAGALVAVFFLAAAAIYEYCKSNDLKNLEQQQSLLNREAIELYHSNNLHQHSRVIFSNDVFKHLNSTRSQRDMERQINAERSPL